MVVSAANLQKVLGITKVKFISRASHLAIVDSSLADSE
jgi:Icc protein